MKVTQQFLDDIKTANGDWTPSQLRLLGLSHPPHRGWRDLVHGMILNDDIARDLRMLANSSSAMVGKRLAPGDLISLWTDGSCHPNPGPGGWAWHDGNEREACGGERHTTNNRMELIAILMALRAHDDGVKLAVYSDSQYCVNGLTVWSPGWKRNNWKKKGEPMPNRDLWLALEEQKARLHAQFRWVRGHAGDPNNERADRLALRGRESLIPR